LLWQGKKKTLVLAGKMDVHQKITYQGEKREKKKEEKKERERN